MHSLLSTSALLALATPVFTAPGNTVVVEESIKQTEVNFKAVSIRDNFCHGGEADIPVADESSYSAGVIVAVKGDINCFGQKYNHRMNTPAHLTYEKALFLYQDIHHLIIHTLTKTGEKRMIRLVEIAAKIQRAFEYLDEAAKLNKHDKHHIRRKWIRHEIKHLRGKLENARWFALHLPNLALCQEAFHFVIDTSLKIIKVIAEIPLVIGAAVGMAIHWAIHAVVDAFHFMAHVLKWTIRGIVGAFIKFFKKVKAGLKKFGHTLHKIGHHIKEDLKDIGSVLLDIGHHMFHKTHCSKGDFGVVIVAVEEEKEEECTYEEEDLCIIGEKQCTREQFTARVTAHYDVQFEWTEQESVERVTECMKKVNMGFLQMKEELRAQEVQVTQTNWEASEDAKEEIDDE
jgi:hypothetical protein